MVERLLEIVEGILRILKVEGVYLTLDPSHSPDRITGYIGQPDVVEAPKDLYRFIIVVLECIY
jgi:hypothetical protein